MASDTRYMTHDKWSSLTAAQVTYPSGRQVSGSYDALYRCNGMTETSGGASIAAWDFFGNRTAKVALGNGITCSYMNNAQTNSAVQAGVPNPAWGDKTTDRLGYDGSDRLIAKRFLPAGSTTSLVGFTTTYDPSSNKLYERALHAESRSTLYPGYDSMDRLREYQRGVLASGGASISTPITLPGTDKQRSYDLDPLGNWKSTVFIPEGTSTPTTEIRQHNKLNEITQFGSTAVLYDHGNNAGNPNPLIAQRGNGNIVDDGTRLYAYDALNRLVTVKRKSDSAPIAAYTYDALGRRVLKVVTNGGVSGTIANATYRYIYDRQQIVEELLSSGGSYATLRQFVWGQYIDELIQLKIPTTTSTPPLTAGTYYPLQDMLYRTTALTDGSGAITGAYDYDAYGNTLMFSAAGTGGNWWADDATTTLQPPCEFLFTGRQYHSETEIYWYRARYYLQGLGRFLGRDPIGYKGGLALYQYLVSRPINGTDPLGLYDSWIHIAMTTSVLMFSCLSQKMKNDIIYMSWWVDFEAHSQDIEPEYTAQHAMAGWLEKENRYQTKEEAEKTWKAGIAKEMENATLHCNPLELGRALHAAQDKYAWGHNFNPWKPAAEMFGTKIPDPLHMIADLGPTPWDWFAATIDSTGYVKQFEDACCCKKKSAPPGGDFFPPGLGGWKPYGR